MPPHLWYNRPVPIRARSLTILLALTGLLSACTAQAPEVTPTASVTLAPYRTPTASPTASRPTSTLPPIVTPGPSPTPLAHIVQANDTLLGIARRYGVDLEDLLAVNPGINPRFLSIGQAVLIPGPEGQPVSALAPTPTPVSVLLSPARCYRTLADGLWCLALVSNPLEVLVEGVTALITLVDEEGKALDSRVAHSPLRQIPPGGGLPLAAYFDSPAPRAASAAIVLLSALASESAESRALPLVTRMGASQPAHDRLRWSAAAEVSLDAAAPGPAARVTVVLVGYDAAGAVAGFAVREWNEPLPPGGSLSFSLTVYSLGPELARVGLLAEALAGE